MVVCAAVTPLPTFLLTHHTDIHTAYTCTLQLSSARFNYRRRALHRRLQASNNLKRSECMVVKETVATAYNAGVQTKGNEEIEIISFYT